MSSNYDSIIGLIDLGIYFILIHKSYYYLYYLKKLFIWSKIGHFFNYYYYFFHKKNKIPEKKEDNELSKQIDNKLRNNQQLVVERKQAKIYLCDWGGIGSRRIEKISIGSDRVFVGFRWNPIENDRICRSNWLSWVLSKE